MPKSKEFVESDSSSSGSSSEKEKKGKKRQKKEIKQQEAKGESSNKKAKKEDMIWDLGDKCKVTIREYRGKSLIDVRHMYEDKDGELKPTKKGICFTPKLWKNFMEVVEEVDKTFKEKC